MRGYPNHNFPAFDAAAEEIRRLGHEVVNPAEMDRAAGVSGAEDQVNPEYLAKAMRRDIDAVYGVDAVYLLPGWSASAGAQVERALAIYLGKEVLPPNWINCVKLGVRPDSGVGRRLLPKSEVGRLVPESEALGQIRQFETGATRDTDIGKLDYEGFLSPLVLRRYAEYMHSHRIQPDGALRDSDNWQKGIPRDQYMKSMWRHFMDVWTAHRGYGYGSDEWLETALCAVLFNVCGYLHEILKGNK